MLDCGGTPYNPLHYLRCNGEVALKTGSKPRCCGIESYDSVFTLCCGGNIFPKQGERPGCCGSQPFDAAVSLCCRADSVVPKRGSQPRCCGRQGYDPNIERCCLVMLLCCGVGKNLPIARKTPKRFKETNMMKLFGGCSCNHLRLTFYIG